MNVALMGMTHSRWRLAARLLESVSVYLVSIGGPPGNVYQFWDWPDPELLPTQLTVGSADPNHFPYGYLVEPD